MAARTFVVRRARTADLEAIHRLNRELQAYEKKLRRSRRSARTLPRDYVGALLRRDKRNAGRLFVATASGAVIAFLSCMLESDMLESHPLAVTITDFIVTARWRRKGLGTVLLGCAEEFARDNGARSIVITTLAENSGARRAYGASGFRESAVTFERRIEARASKRK